MVKYFNSISARLVPALADAEPVALAVLYQDLLPDAAYTVRMVALSVVGLDRFSSPSGVTLAETNDTHHRDLAAKVERTRKFQSSLQRSCLKRGRCDLWATMYSSGIVATCGRASRRLRRL